MGEEEDVLLSGDVAQGLGQGGQLVDEVPGLVLGFLAAPAEVGLAPFHRRLGARADVRSLAPGRGPVLELRGPVLLFDALGPPGGLAGIHGLERLADLGVIGRQVLVDGQPPRQGIGHEGELVAGLDLLVQEMEGGLLGFLDPAGIVEGEVEEEDEPAGDAGLRGRAFAAGLGRPDLGLRRRFARPDGPGLRAGPGDRPDLEFRDVDGLAVVGDDEIALHEVRDGVPLLVHDVDLDEMEDDGDLDLDGRLLEGLGAVLGRGRAPG